MPDQPRGLLAERYRLVSPIGQGGMGRVWEARDELLGREVAIKEIAPDGLSAAELGDLRERAIREARAIAKVNHPHVVRVFDVIDEAGVPWIVMELVRSRSLLSVVNDDGPMDPRKAARVGLDVLAALRAAHRAGILHRDVKPANVLLADDGRAVLTDFGLAAAAGDSSMTRTGVVLGSPSYLAPERALDEPARPSSDLWSLGATLFAAVEGRPPYAKSSPMATLASLMVDPSPVSQHAGVLGPALAALLKKDPSERAQGEDAERLLRAAADGVMPDPARRPASPPAPAAPFVPAAAPSALAPPAGRPPSVPASAPPSAPSWPAPTVPPKPPSARRRRVLLAVLAVVVIAAIPVAFVLGDRGSHGSTAQAAQAAQANNAPGIASLDPTRSTAARSAPSVSPSGSAPASVPQTAPASRPALATTRPPVTKAPPVVKPTTHTLTAAFNNVGVTDDANTTAGNFDGGGATYSKQGFASGGVTPGKTITVGGVGLTWPSSAGTGRKDNAIAAGQTITVPGSGRTLAFLIASDYGAVTGTGHVTYTDGTTQDYTLTSPDWFNYGDSSAVAVAAYQNRAGADRFDEPAAVFGVTVALAAGKTVASVRLPSVGAVPAREQTTTLHFFAARIG